MTDLEERTQLEIEFAEKLDFVIHQLIYYNFSDEDIVVFTETVKTFMAYVDLKQFIIDVLYDKVCEASKIIKPHDMSRFLSYRKLIRVILDLGDNELIEQLETHLAKHNHPDHFFVFLEEKIARGINTDSSETIFIELIYLNREAQIKVINKFLRLIDKDPSYFLKKLLVTKLDRSWNFSVKRYISEVIANEPETLENHIIPTLIQHYDNGLEHYLSIIVEIISITDKFTRSLIDDNKWKCQAALWSQIINGLTFNTKLVKHFCLYLKDHYPDKVEEFEDSFLDNADPDHIVKYAIEVSFSKKRKILRKLIELKSEKWLVEFIKNFPEYKSLLPLL
jgi:hypothetical protein